MRVRSIAAVTVGLSLCGAAAFWVQASADRAAPTEIPHAVSSKTSSSMPLEMIVTVAADRAALAMMCRDGLTDEAAKIRYEATAAAHPELAQAIRSDCSVDATQP